MSIGGEAGRFLWASENRRIHYAVSGSEGGGSEMAVEIPLAPWSHALGQESERQVLVRHEAHAYCKRSGPGVRSPEPSPRF